MAKAKLSDEVKTYIVQALGCFDAPSIVVAAVKKEFGIEFSRQLVERHDPNTKATSSWRRGGQSMGGDCREVGLLAPASVTILYEID
jgi:hypothetical protein